MPCDLSLRPAKHMGLHVGPPASRRLLHQSLAVKAYGRGLFLCRAQPDSLGICCETCQDGRMLRFCMMLNFSASGASKREASYVHILPRRGCTSSRPLPCCVSTKIKKRTEYVHSRKHPQPWTPHRYTFQNMVEPRLESDAVPKTCCIRIAPSPCY